MRRLLAILSVPSMIAIMCAVSHSSEPASSKQRFDSVVTNLDIGGDILVVANLEGTVQGLVSNITQIVTAFAPSGQDSVEFQRTFNKIPGFLQRNGFFALQGFGLSVVPRADGLNSVKVFLARDRAAAGSPLWLGFVGGQPKIPTCTGFIPADTVLARTGTGELAQLWKLIRSGVAEFASPDGNAAFDRTMSNLSTNMGVSIDKVLESVNGEGFFSLQLSRTNTIEMGGPSTSIPSPSILVCMAVKDDTLIKAIEQPLSRVKMPIVRTQSESTVVSTINLPMRTPFPFHPSYAMCSNFFLLGSTPEVVSDAIRAFKSNNGLVATPEYKKAFVGMPTSNNGIFYQSPRFMKALLDLQTATLGGGKGDGSQQAAMQSLFGVKGEMQSAFVIQNRPDGVLTTGITASGGKEMLGAILIAPIGLMAGIAIPSFMNARTVSSQNACINNLRQIDAAKEQWALEARKKDGDQVDIQGISKYIKGNKIPTCPQGGTYKINAIGTNPECDFPGHHLQSQTDMPPTNATTPLMIHEVQPNEDLAKIGMMYGTSVEKIMTANGMTSKTVRPGQRIKIP
jgi:hypothetical protein